MYFIAIFNNKYYFESSTQGIKTEALTVHNARVAASSKGQTKLAMLRDNQCLIK